MAEGVVLLNVKKLSAISDYIVICSAGSDRQVHAIAENISDGLAKAGIRPLGMEGVTEGRWALLDFNDVVVHIFLEDLRAFYDLEGLWADAPLTKVAERQGKRRPQAKKAGP
jgi:ribosome-associated protein